MSKETKKSKTSAATGFGGMQSALKTFGTDLKQKFALPGSASPEDQLKGPIGDLAKAAGAAIGLTVLTKTEAHLSEYSVRPDVAVYSAGLICGYIELKQPGLGADAPKLKGKHNKDQWEKLKNIPNLIYTDGREWALYRNGDRVGSILRFDADPSDDGEKAITTEKADDFDELFRDFLFWAPQIPHKPNELAKYLAPLTRLLRDEVQQALRIPGSNVNLLASEWRQYFFPDANDAQFADAYAQTVTYALLLARLHGETKLEPQQAAKALNSGNSVLALALDRLGQPGAKDELRLGFELLQRSLEALDPNKFLKTKPDLWLYFYEDFLGAYDQKLRKDYGVYYTPREVVALQVRLAAELLDKRFHRKLGFADDDVIFLDPAVGTGTYLVAAIDHGLKKVKARSGPGAVAGRATLMAENMYGFEILVGPYAVAHLRLTQAIEGAGGMLPTEKRLRVFLADTLESPNASPPGGLTLTYKALTQEHEAARKLKKGGEILVCLGNPPYDRQHIEQGDTSTQRKGGWVRFGDQIKGGAKQEAQGERPIFTDFMEPASKAGAGVHLKNLYNDYVYFWRWALWRLFEQQSCGGIVTFITASSYLAGPGFVGMREVMRRTFDELWIIDVGGDNLGTRKTANVFNIQTPVAIAIGIRGPKPSPATPARAHYATITGDTREAKLAKLEAIDKLADLAWRDCSTDWQTPLLPIGHGNFFEWPLITDLFPWAHSGAQFKRSWPIGETVNVLKKRFEVLRAAPNAERKRLFKESRDRKVTFNSTGELPGSGQPSVRDIGPSTTCNNIRIYAFRSFDRHYAIIDTRFGDYLRPALINSLSERQVFFSTLLTNALAEGQGIVAAAHLPDLHHFRGSFGGRDVLPLYRDAEATQANVTIGLLELLAGSFGSPVTAEDLAAYVYAVLGCQAYTKRFWSELETPGPRVPITKNDMLFRKTAALGRHLIWLHTYGERFQPTGNASEIPSGTAKAINGIANDPAKYPEAFEYNPIAKEIRVGAGRFGPVPAEIWEFEVSGLKVVRSWLGYRMRARAGKKSSPLDDIRPERWSARMTDEFLELLWVLEATLAMEPELSAALDTVVGGPCFTGSELPQATEDERKAPKVKDDEGDLLAMLDADEEDEVEDV